MQNVKNYNIDISIIIPTYNEKDNMKTLFDEIDKYLNDMRYEIIVVDDNSQDGTIEIVEELSNDYPATLIVRKNERGLASAVVKGFKNAKGNILIVMDADFQHPPEKIISLIEEINKGSDIAIASRHNGGEFGNFNIVRSTISKGANVIAKILFPKLSNIKDVQSGFFALKRDVIKDIDLNPTGYKILLEILILGKYKSIKEIGYKFGDREYGTSKLGARTIIDYIHHLISLSYRTGEINKLLKYSIVGISGIGVNMLILFFFTDRLGTFYLLSSAIAYETSIFTNFVVNDMWTFKNIDNKSNFLTRAVYFNYAMITGAILGMILLYIFTSLLSIYYLVSNIISIIIVFLWRYYASITSVWKHRWDRS